MNSTVSESPEPPTQAKSFSGLKVLIIVLVTVGVTLGAVWVVRTYIYPSAFRPTELSAREQSVVDGKLEQLGVGGIYDAEPAESARLLEPEPYREDEGRRLISFTEKELNGLLAYNTDLASRLAIDLSRNLASAKLLLPMDEDVPFVGGKTIRIDAGLELSFTSNRPVVALRGVSVMGVPVPNAWLGNLKDVDLVQQFGSDRGFWQAFAEGIESLEIEDGELQIQLKD
ncbi:MAG: arginine N-succinyltransferase [Gammaproteobacteria bacterium]|nr:arginine N-succinyltransferase [Gammaproteobacteria bacterium]MDH3508537.1 arginine N-succinyltransferase [Gammaproteobacteria bacterium]